MNLDPKIVQLLKDAREYTKRERADEDVSNPEMVELWLRICKNARSRAVAELIRYMES